MTASHAHLSSVHAKLWLSRNNGLPSVADRLLVSISSGEYWRASISGGFECVMVHVDRNFTGRAAALSRLPTQEDRFVSILLT